VICACGCGRPVEGRVQRGLREGCYTRARRAGTLWDYPRTARPSADTAEDAVILHGRGSDLAAIAAMLARAPSSIITALDRQRTRLDRPDPTLERVLAELRHQQEVQRWAALSPEQREQGYARQRAARKAS
jgi:hypothetical protein